MYVTSQVISQPLLKKMSTSPSPQPKLPSLITRAQIGLPLPAPFVLAIYAPSPPRFFNSLLSSLTHLLLFHFHRLTLSPSQVTEKKSELAKLETIDSGKPLDEAAWDIVTN